jgi:hypothetical protein
MTPESLLIAVVGFTAGFVFAWAIRAIVRRTP